MKSGIQLPVRVDCRRDGQIGMVDAVGTVIMDYRPIEFGNVEWQIRFLVATLLNDRMQDRQKVEHWKEEKAWREQRQDYQVLMGMLVGMIEGWVERGLITSQRANHKGILKMAKEIAAKR